MGNLDVCTTTNPMCRDRKKRTKKQLVNLYQFQQRETRRQQIAELRKQFLEDKQRVAVMRSQRKFKPFS